MQRQGFLKTFTKLFPVPKDMNFDFVGIDFCKNSVKVMKIKNTKLGRVPEKYAEYQFEQECTIWDDDGPSEIPEEKLNYLKKIKKDFGVNYVVVSIPEVKTFIYKTELPKNVGSKIQDTLLFGVEENVPIDHEDVLIDFFVSEIRGDQIEVIVTAVSKTLAENLSKIFESVGLQVLGFEPETHAVSRAVISEGDSNHYMLLNLDACVSSMAVVCNGLVQHTQILPISNNDFSKEFDLNTAQALLENINKIIIFWETQAQNEGNKIKTIFLFGEYCFSDDLLNFLERKLPINVKFANVWRNAFSFNDYFPKIHMRESLKYAACVGLSLKKIQ